MASSRSIRLWLISGLLLLAVANVRQEGAQSSAVVQGLVVMKGSDVPITNAKVILSEVGGNAQDAATAVGAENGRFVFTNVPSGTYRLFVESEGYVRTEYGQDKVNMPGKLLKIANVTQTSVRIELTKLAVIHGRVVTESGGPAASFRVRAMKARYEEGRRELTPARDTTSGGLGRLFETTTDDRGDFRLYGLIPGRYFIGAYLPRTTGSSQDSVQAAAALAGVIVPVFYPGNTSDPQRAIAIDLKAGELFDVGALVNLRVPSVHIRGEIVDSATGRIATSCEVRVHEGSLEAVRSLRKESCRGKFDFSGLAPGRYTIAASIPGLTGADSSSGALEIEVGLTDLTNLKVLLQRGFPLRGRISFEGRARSDNDPELEKLQIQFPQGRVSMTPLNRDGTFSFTRVSQGTLHPRIIGLNPDAYIKTVRLGNRDLTDSGLVVAGPVNGVLEIVIGVKGAGVTVSVKDESQTLFAGAIVALVPDPARQKNWRLYKSAVSDGEGKVQLQGIPPGDYTLFAWEEVDENAWQSPEFLEAFESRGIRIHLSEGMRQDVVAPLIPVGVSR